MTAKGQEVSVHGGFFSDSVSIGEQTRYFLAVKYPSRLNIIFPDSSYNFYPFEFERKQYFPTETKDSISYDSVIYAVSTFEIDSIQILALPIFVINKADSTVYTAQADSILLHQLVDKYPDSVSADKLPLKMNTAYQNVSYLINYPIIAIAVAILLCSAFIGWLIFGKRIRKYYRIKKLNKKHQQFVQKYEAYIDEIKKTTSKVATESALVTWKNYIEHLVSMPYTKLTTREILTLEKDSELGNNLNAIDRTIYGNETSVIVPLEKLKAYADQKFFKKLEEVKHGK